MTTDQEKIFLHLAAISRALAQLSFLSDQFKKEMEELAQEAETCARRIEQEK